MVDASGVHLDPWLWVGSLLAVTLITSGVSWVLVRATRDRTDADADKLRAEAASLITDAAGEVIATYRDELEIAKARIMGLESELEMQKGYRQDLADRVAKLERWIVANTHIADPATEINGRH